MIHGEVLRVINPDGTVVFTRDLAEVMGSRVTNFFRARVEGLSGGKILLYWESSSTDYQDKRNSSTPIQFALLDADGSTLLGATDLSTYTAEYNCCTQRCRTAHAGVVLSLGWLPGQRATQRSNDIPQPPPSADRLSAFLEGG